jgi:hypothetical protein
MSLNIADGQRVTVWKVEEKGNYGLVQFSSSRKDKRIDDPKKQWINSSWSFVRFVGKAHDKLGELDRNAKIELHGATLSKEPYEKDGETVYPAQPQLVVFDFSVPTSAEGGSKEFDKAPEVQDEDSIPF